MTSDLQKMEQARSFSPVFASQDVSWYTFPWQPWRSNPLHARGSGTGRLSRAGSRCSFTLHSAGSPGTDTGPWLSPARGLGRRGSSSSRLREPRTGEPHSRWERFEAGKRHRGSGKLTAALCSTLLESFLHLLLSPRVICTQIKHGW